MALKMKHVEQSVLIPVWKTPSIDFEDIHCEYFYRKSGILARLMFRKKIRQLTQFALEKFEVETYNMIHAHTWFSDGAVAYKLYKKYGIPYIVAIRNTDLNIFYKYFIHLRKLGNRILENASQIIFISPAYKDYFENQIVSKKIKNKISKKICIIPNGISPFWVQHKHQKTAISSPVKLLSIGAITPNKNFPAICNAVELLRAKGIDLELTIVGKGYRDVPSCLKILENHINEKPYFKILKKQSEEELLHTYRSHDIFVLPSHTETFGLVYIEALTQGLPVIYTKGQGIDGYFESGKIGYAVHSKNIEELAEAIHNTICNISDITANINQLDFSVFSWESIAERYGEIYLQIFNKYLTDR